MKRLLTVSSLAILFIYIAIVLFVYQNQRNIMYQPILEKIVTDDWGVTGVEIIHIQTEDGIHLEGWYVPPQKENNRIIVFFHGNGQNIGSSYSGVSGLLEDGYGLLMVEYRGYAGHKGRFTEQGVYKDCRAFINWLSQTHHIKYSDMIFYGESLGTALAVQMASEYGGHTLILLAPFSSMVEMAKIRYSYLPVYFLLKDKYLSDKKIRQISMPILILHGDNDSIVSIKLGKKLFDAANTPKKFIKINDGTHTNLYELYALNYIRAFLENEKGRQ